MKEARVNVSDSGLPSNPTVALKPRWIVVLILMLVAYLLLRPWLVERFGWNLPGLTEVNPQVSSDEAATAEQRSVEKRKANRPIDVPVIPEQSEPDPGDETQTASGDDADLEVVQATVPDASKTSTDVGRPSPTRSSQGKPPSTAPSQGPAQPAPSSQSQPSAVPTSKATSPTPGPQSVPRGPPAPSTANKSPSSNKTQQATKKPSPAANDKDKDPEWGGLTQVGRDRFESAEGLVYNQYRIDHVMEHARDNPDKPTHGIFEGTTQDEILALIDEAYSIARKRGPPQVVIEEQGNRTTYTVNMNRKIGRSGGQSGARNRNRALNKLKLVLEDEEVVTAYPTN